MLTPRNDLRDEDKKHFEDLGFNALIHAHHGKLIVGQDEFDDVFTATIVNILYFSKSCGFDCRQIDLAAHAGRIFLEETESAVNAAGAKKRSP